jgi:hypothetical protein
MWVWMGIEKLAQRPFQLPLSPCRPFAPCVDHHSFNSDQGNGDEPEKKEVKKGCGKKRVTN